MRADPRRLLEHGDRHVTDRVPRDALRDRRVVPPDQPGEVDGARETRGPRPDELDVEVEDFSFHRLTDLRPRRRYDFVAASCATWASGAACAWASSQRSASIAAMHPVPAAVTACR